MLTERESRFAQAFVSNGGNGTAAARDAGYTGSDATLAAYASRLRRKPDVADEIERLTGAAGVEPVLEAPPLDPKHAAFVAAYAKHGNGARAARAAGFSRSSAARVAVELLARADVHEAVEVERAKVEAAAIATTRELQQILTSIVRSKRTRPGDRVKAANLLSKMLGADVARARVADVVPTAQVQLVIVDNGRGPALEVSAKPTTIN